MSSYQVANFELRLREAVRRLSRKEQYDDARLMWRTVHISNAEWSQIGSTILLRFGAN